jgi:hypothetical protein
MFLVTPNHSELAERDQVHLLLYLDKLTLGSYLGRSPRNLYTPQESQARAERDYGEG